VNLRRPLVSPSSLGRWMGTAAMALVSSLVVTACTSEPSITGTDTSIVIEESTEVSVPAPVDLTIRYGEEPSQFGRLRVPGRRFSAPPVVVLIHGGFWRDEYGLDLMDPLADDLDRRGYATWNIEYRRVDEPGGGYPGTLIDVATAIDKLVRLADIYTVDLANVALVGHSSGGHLALWAAMRGSLAVGQPGASPSVVPRLGIGLGPVVNLRRADAEALGGDAVAQFIGGHFAEYPDRYGIAAPPTAAGVKLAVVRGSDDDIVPARFTEYPLATDVETIDTAGDHFALIDPKSVAWSEVITLLRRELPVVRSRATSRR
jgi:acetyl esterase/lipase